MTKTARLRAIEALNQYIWSLKGKCESVTEVNKQLIAQYCRFVILCEEISLELIDGNLSQEDIDNFVKNYEKFNKIALNLYKVLKFEQIKEELSNFDNPFTRLLKEEEEDDDL